MKNIITRGVTVFALLFCVTVFTFGQSARQNDLGKVLVLYYSYSKNANTEKVAKIIQKLTNADIVKIEPAAPFPQMEYRQFTQWVREQQRQQVYPAIKNLDVDIASYDFIFVGTPVWWGMPSLPVSSLLRQIDFERKPLAVFSTAQGGPGSAVKDIERHAKNALVKGGMNFSDVSGDDGREINEKVTAWVSSLQK